VESESLVNDGAIHQEAEDHEAEEGIHLIGK
jgi:hypothetical protein